MSVQLGLRKKKKKTEKNTKTFEPLSCCMFCFDTFLPQSVINGEKAKIDGYLVLET